MQTLRGEYYLKHDFGFYDAGILPVVGPTLPWVYDVLRRFVWRSLQTGDLEMRALYAEGLLAAKVRQKVIGAYLGLSRQQICLYVGQLKALGWLRSIDLKSTYGMQAYVLGEALRDGMGRMHEVFYADAFLRDLWDGLCVAAIEKQGTGATPMDLPMEERVAHVRAVVEPLLAKAEEPKDIEEPEGEGCQENQTGGVKKTRQGVSRKPDTPCQVDLTLEGREDLKVEKQEGREHMPLSRQVCVPPTSPVEAIPFYAPTEHLSEDERIQAIKADNIRRTTEMLDADLKNTSKRENFKGKEPPIKNRKALSELAEHWHSLITQRNPTITIPRWDSRGKEFKQLQQIVEKYDAVIVRDGITYVLTNWDKLRDRMFKGQGGLPTIGMILKLHDTLLIESQQCAAAKRVVEDVRALREKDFYAAVPEDLEAKYTRALADLKALGFEV